MFLGKDGVIIIDTMETNEAEITPRLKENLDMMVHADSVKWEEMLATLRSHVTTLAGFEYSRGNMIEFTTSKSPLICVKQTRKR